MNKTNLNYILLAREDDPHGTNCGFCGNKNDFADDCGWFYIMSPFDMYEVILKPCCNKCYWKYGDNHRRLYGVGDR